MCYIICAYFIQHYNPSFWQRIVHKQLDTNLLEIQNQNKDLNYYGWTSGRVLFQSHWRAEPSSNGETLSQTCE